MQKEYNYQEIEEKWQAYWEKHNPYQTPVAKAGQNKAYVLDMFPYPSGSGLHMGHPLGYTGTDIYSRFKRLKGFSVLHPMGFDAFGLPAEQHAIRTGNHPAEFTKQNCEVFKTQLKRLGFSYDWEREIATCDPDYYQWTQWIFLKIYNSWFDRESQKCRPIEELHIPAEIAKQGAQAVQEYQSKYRLAYYGVADVNWCPALGTVLANEEVIDGKSERGGYDVFKKPMRQWLLRITEYSERLINDLQELDWPESIKQQQRNWIGRSEGVNIRQKVKDLGIDVAVYDSIPQTFLAQTFCVIAPEHKLVKELVAGTKYEESVLKFVDEIAERKLRKKFDIENDLEGIFTGRYLDNPFGTGDLPIWIASYVLADYGTGMVNCSSHDQRDFSFAKKYNIPLKVAMLPQDPAEQEKVKNFEYSYLAPDGIIQEPLECRGMTWAQSREAIINYMVEKDLADRKVNYRLRDWLFSRQRYWGEPIPVIHWEDGLTTPLAEDELPLILPNVTDYKPSEDGESPLAKAGDWLNVICPKTGKKGRRETNTMPQWAGSCWYYLRFIDPKNSKLPWAKDLEQSWMNVDLYVGGAEHAVLHLLYARFWHKVLYDLGYVSTNEPFQRLFNQGMLTSYAYKDGRGALVAVDEVKTNEAGEHVVISTGEKVERITAKMSKSLRNVVTPDEIVSEYGADTLRTFLMFMAPLEAQKSWDSQAITGVNRFLKKAYSFIANRAEFANEEQEDLQVKKLLAALIHKMTQDLEELRFNTPVSSMMEFLNHVSALKVSKASASKFVILLSPYAPHLAEELWSILGHNKSVSQTTWPEYDPDLLKQDKINVVIQVNGKKRSNLEVDVKIPEDVLKQLIVDSLKNSPHPVSLADRFILVKNPKDGTVKLANVISGA